MRILFITLSIIAALLGLTLSILPFNSLAFFPLAAAFLFGLIAVKFSKKENKSITIIKLIFAITILALALNIYNVLKPNEIVIDQDAIENEAQSQEDALEDLEDLDIE